MPNYFDVPENMSNEIYQDAASPKVEIDSSFIRKGIEILKRYKAGKENLEAKIISNEQWWKMRHWDEVRAKKSESGEPEPVTAYLFNTIANKHADAMDNYPEPNILPREQDDEDESKKLSKIVPVVIEKNNYKMVYDDAWWYKLKHGFSVQGVFWNPEAENGLGDIKIQKIDALNVYWEPGITDIQDSANLFIVTLVDDDVLMDQYPEIGKISGEKIIDTKKYIYDDNVDVSQKSLVVDWYYKKRVNGKTEVHLTKFVNDKKLASTEDEVNEPKLMEPMEMGRDNWMESPKGLYNHGLYPIEIDVLFPEEGQPIGFGYIDISKNPQMYIDKLDQIISRNALQAGKQRFIIKENGNINEKELMDYSNDVIHTKGNVGEEDFRIFQGESLPGFIIQHRKMKIEELKETTGANDFNRGNGGSGVTAAAAIMALQEAGSKMSRDMIQRSYNTYSKLVYMSIELIRQFYDDERKFRITGQDGTNEYINYSNAGLKNQMLPQMYPGEEPKYRCPIFDIKVRPERQSPFSRMAHNELAKELFGAGMFNPQIADQALIALEMMSFEGRDVIIQKVSQNSMMMQQIQQLTQENIQLKMTIQQLTGRDMGLQQQQGGMPSGQGVIQAG